MRLPGRHGFAFGLGIALFAGCTVEGAGNLCEQANDHLAECGYQGELAADPVCTPEHEKVAKDILASDCDDILGVIGSGGVCYPPWNCPAGAIEGAFSPPIELPLFVVHAGLGRDGKVMYFSGDQPNADPALASWFPLQSGVWDPNTGQSSLQSYSDNLFCAGHSWMADGRMLAAGGHPPAVGYFAQIWDPLTAGWQKIADMNIARWYPTVLTMPDGRILSASGVAGVAPAEIYSPVQDRWDIVSGSARNLSQTYPGLYVVPGGHVFYAPVGWFYPSSQAAYLTLSSATEGAWTELSPMVHQQRKEASSILLVDDSGAAPSAQVYVVGGGDDGIGDQVQPLSEIEAIDVSDVTQQPSWSVVGNLAQARINPNLVALPDGKVLVVGGRAGDKYKPQEGGGDASPVLQAEIFDPDTRTSVPVASLSDSRHYHSVAVLLPDGRVWIAGGQEYAANPELQVPGLNADQLQRVRADQRTLEIYSPPYLSAGNRPIITDVGTAQIDHGAEFTVQVSDPGSIGEVRLITPLSVTHHTDTGRAVELEITERGDYWLRLRAPRDGSVAPPGWYLLFVEDTAGVPSVGVFMHVGSTGSSSNGQSVMAIEAVGLQAQDGMLTGWQGFPPAAFRVVVPFGATNAVVRTSGGTGDADLYVKKGGSPTTSDFTCRSWTAGSQETCALTEPGTYYVGVNAYQPFSGVTLTAQYTAP
jgi:hypothetical protein